MSSRLIWNTNCAYEILQKNYISFVIKILHSKRTLLNAWIQFCKTLVQRVSSRRSHQTQQNKFYGFHPWQANLSTNFLRHNSMLQSPKHGDVGDVSICSFQSFDKFFEAQFHVAISEAWRRLHMFVPKLEKIFSELIRIGLESIWNKNCYLSQVIF